VLLEDEVDGVLLELELLLTLESEEVELLVDGVLELLELLVLKLLSEESLEVELEDVDGVLLELLVLRLLKEESLEIELEDVDGVLELLELEVELELSSSLDDELEGVLELLELL